MNEAERVEAAFYEILAKGETPTGSKIAKHMGVRNINGRIQAKREELLKAHWFTKHNNRWVRTRQWCPACGGVVVWVDAGFCGDGECAIQLQN